MAKLQDQVGLSNDDLRKLRSMRPGTAVDLQITSVNTTKRVRSEFVGMDGTKSIIIRFPDEAKWGALREFVFPNNSLVVRYILEDETGEIIAFKVKVTLIITKPSHLIFTTFPSLIQSHGLRSERRTQTRLSVILKDALLDKKICVCLVRDISFKGCQICIEKSVKAHPIINQNVVMQFNDVAGNVLVLSGEIKNSKSDEVNFYYGLKFQTSEKEVEQLMQKIMLTTD